MKLVFLIFILSCRLGFSQEIIKKYTVDINLTAEQVMSVTEHITYDFGSSQKHGIIRDIVIYDQWKNLRYFY